MSSPYPCPRIEWVEINGQRVTSNGGGIEITRQVTSEEESESITVDLNVDVMVANPCGPGYIYCKAYINGSTLEFDTYSIGGDENDMPLQFRGVELKSGENELRIEAGLINPTNDEHFKTDEWIVYINYVPVSQGQPPENPPYPVPTPPTPTTQPTTQSPLNQIAQWVMAMQPSDLVKIGVAVIAFAVVAGIITRIARS